MGKMYPVVTVKQPFMYSSTKQNKLFDTLSVNVLKKKKKKKKKTLTFITPCNFLFAFVSPS